MALFEEDAGAVTPRRLRITLRGNEMWATYVPLPQDSRWIEELAGVYYSGELEVAYTISVQDVWLPFAMSLRWMGNVKE